MGSSHHAVAGLIALSLLGGCRSRNDRDGAVRLEKVADQKMERLRLQSYGKTGLEWDLAAPVAEGFSDDGRTLIKNLTVNLYENGQKSTTVTADEGLMFSGESKNSELYLSTYSVTLKPGDMFLNGNVVMISTEGHRLNTDWAHYKRAVDLIVSSAPVTVIRDDSTTKGLGMEATSDLSNVKIFKQTLVIPDRPDSSTK